MQYFVDLAMHISWQVQDFVDVSLECRCADFVAGVVLCGC